MAQTWFRQLRPHVILPCKIGGFWILGKERYVSKTLFLTFVYQNVTMRFSDILSEYVAETFSSCSAPATVQTRHFPPLPTTKCVFPFLCTTLFKSLEHAASHDCIFWRTEWFKREDEKDLISKIRLCDNIHRIYSLQMWLFDFGWNVSPVFADLSYCLPKQSLSWSLHFYLSMAIWRNVEIHSGIS